MREMKDSGVFWFGAVPADVPISRFGRHYDVILGKMLCTEKKTPRHALNPYYCAANVHFSGLDAASGLKEMWFTPEELEALTVREGDLLVAEGGAGGCAMVRARDPKAAIQNSVMIVRSAGGSVRFARYLLECLIRAGYIDFVCNRVTISHFTKEKLQAVPFPLFPLRRQKAIASFLDDRCARIDAVVEKLRRQIAVLQELRQSVICRAVTKGLNPDAEMKDSGTSWAGDVPDGWEVRRLKHLASFSKGLSITKADLAESGLPVVSYGQIHSKANRGTGLHDGLVRFVPESFAACRSSLAAPGSFIFADTSEDLEGVGNFVLVDREGPLFGGYHSIIVSLAAPGALSRFLAYLFLSGSWRRQLRGDAAGTKVYSITQKMLKDAEVLLPPLSEQESIAAFLDAECARIDAVAAGKARQISTLEDYRKALIYGAVTGKTEVPAE